MQIYCLGLVQMRCCPSPPAVPHQNETPNAVCSLLDPGPAKGDQLLLCNLVVIFSRLLVVVGKECERF